MFRVPRSPAFPRALVVASLAKVFPMHDFSQVIDISPRVSPRMGVFPGDVPFSHVGPDSPDHAHAAKPSAFRTTAHLGAHADAPSHSSPDGADIAGVELARYLGPCEVVRAVVPRGTRAGARHLPPDYVPAAPRVLIRTDSFPDPEKWNSDFCSLEPALLDFLATHGVVLVGIDTPSVDPEDSVALESHAALARNALSVLEGLTLSHVEPGCYFLSALPLPLAGLDASPVRAVLFGM